MMMKARADPRHGEGQPLQLAPKIGDESIDPGDARAHV